LNWIKNLTATYNLDGIRIDTIPEVPKDFWLKFNENSGVYTIGEVFDGDMNFVHNYYGPLDGLLNYPLWY